MDLRHLCLATLLLASACSLCDGRWELEHDQQVYSTPRNEGRSLLNQADGKWEVAPWDDAWTNSVAFCVIIRNEQLSDVREFLLYHRWLGIDHVHLWENDSTTPIKEGLQEFIDSGFLTYATHAGDAQQAPVYRLCNEMYRHQFNWLMYIDADEFLVLRDKSMPLKSVLAEFKAFPGLSVHWVSFGPNGHEARPAGGGTLRHYTRCNPDPHIHIKTLVNSYFVESVGHPHNQLYRGEATSVNEERVPPQFGYLEDWNRGIDTCRAANPDDASACREVQRRSARGPAFHYFEGRSVKRLAVFHYITKSREDFEVKHSRPEAYFGHKGGSRSWADFDFEVEFSSREHPDCKELANVWQECCSAM